VVPDFPVQEVMREVMVDLNKEYKEKVDINGLKKI
jgi:hypothetical protein